MKNLNTILIAVLILAVGVLYYLHFTTPKTTASESTQVGTTQAPSSFLPTGNILYVNLDTLLSKMDMYKDLTEDFGKKQSQMEANIQTRAKALEKNYADLQNKYSKGLVTRNEGQQLEQQLMNERSELETLQNNYQQQLQEESVVGNRKVINYIEEFLKGYTQGKDIQYVFSYTFGGNILYTDSTNEITNDILGKLNEQYKKEKSSGK